MIQALSAIRGYQNTMYEYLVFAAVAASLKPHIGSTI